MLAKEDMWPVMLCNLWFGGEEEEEEEEFKESEVFLEAILGLVGIGWWDE